ncbi:hypothetical protein KY284_020416 [Solanum tuberosum]|nr:hypothetical protein KY284_020416 [Solanum tuberosum]
MASKDELHENEAVEKPSKIARGKKNNLMGKCSIILPRVVRIYLTDNDATNQLVKRRKIFKERSPNDKK